MNDDGVPETRRSNLRALWYTPEAIDIDRVDAETAPERGAFSPVRPLRCPALAKKS